MINNIYYACFNKEGIINKSSIITKEYQMPIAFQGLVENELITQIDLSLVSNNSIYENNILYYALPAITDKTKDFSYRLVDNIVIYDIDSFNNEKQNKIAILENNYNNALNLKITNSFTFNVNLRSKEGNIFCNIIKMAQGSYHDIKIGSKTQRFFTKIEEVDGLKMIECNAFNWVWLYLFEEILSYTQNLKQLKEKILTDITNAKSSKDLEIINCDFPFSTGLQINVSKVVEKLLKIQNDGDLQIPDYVKTAINAMDRKIFRYTKVDDIITSTQNILNRSCLII